MKILVFSAICLFGLFVNAGAWEETFRSSQCYALGNVVSLSTLIENRMPMSMESFIGLIEKHELVHKFTNPDALADAIIKRYRVDGITYNPEHSIGSGWQAQETEEVDKEDIIMKSVRPTNTLPEASFDHREECALHFMISHSTDIYPHPELENIWDNSRYRRSAALSRKTRYADAQFELQGSVGNKYVLPPGVDPAKHPMETGVVHTYYGPVALGTLLTGIAASNMNNEDTIASLLGDRDSDNMPQEMSSKRISPRHAATLAGDIAQVSVVASLSPTVTKHYVGPKGMFANSSASPNIFTLEEGYDGATTYLTRAEIFAGIDALLIGEALKSMSGSNIKFSQLLRMYYSDHGLPNYPDYKACNRINAFNELNLDDKIKEQALNFMYAYSYKYPEAQRFIKEYVDEFDTINELYTKKLDEAWNVFKSFVGGYTYNDFDRCPTYIKNNAKCENWADLLVVYSREGGSFETQKEREYISHVGMMTSVGISGSRLGVMEGKSGDWILPMSNITNVADWGNNFTMDRQYESGSSGDFMETLDHLREYYYAFYQDLNSSTDNSSANSQVVIWNVPKSAPNFDDEDTLNKWISFTLDFPDVYFLMVGSSVGSYSAVLKDPTNDFFKTTYTDSEEFAQGIAQRACQIPHMYVYPACDTLTYTDFNEGSHLFHGYVSPNYTTYARISPNIFHFSPYVRLTVKSSDVQVCTSRLSMDVDSGADDYECQDGNADFTWHELCGRYLIDCNPIYLSIKGTPHSSSVQCNDDACKFPNQIEYDIEHEGLTCGSWSSTISMLLMLIVALLHYIIV